MIPGSEEQEQALVDALQKGDNAAKSRLYEQFYRYLTAVCARYIVSDEDVKDLIQDVFIKIFKQFEHFEYRGSGSLQAWCHRLAVNEALMYLRARRRHPFLSIERFDRQEMEYSYSENPEIDDIPIQDLLTMIRKLPERYRTVFNLYVLEDKSHKEIADLLHVKESTSQSNLHRARKLLSRFIDEYHKQQHDGR